ncbi:hypothetical protein [Pedobacter sp. ASV28]|uniref:hypothetical protein n=1 Tax=Pedobacter sp. ASV28 TaxID=2795123 RepID=UPI0018ED0697|nr:hypothetical protein [Pedobacter sp. ASV28]
MKKNILITLLLLLAKVTLAQQAFTVSIGGGINDPTSSLKTKSYLGNGYNLNADVFVPFLSKSWDSSVKGSDKFALGIVAGGTYHTAKSLLPNVETLQESYKLYNGTLDITSVKKGASVNKGFTGFAGLQADISFGSLSFSPSLSGGYFSLEQDGFIQRSTVMVNGAAQSIVLSESPKTKTTGFITRPQLKLSYSITGNFSIYTSAAINIGPNIKSAQSYLVPSGGFNEGRTYEATQLASGKMFEQATETHYQALTVNAGLSWNFSSRSKRLRGKVTKPSDGGMLYSAVASKPNSGNGAAAASYAATGKWIAPAEPTGKSISEKGLSGTKSHALVAGQPIGGIVVKGGKNPGGNAMIINTTDQGELELKGLEAGRYTFTITAPDEPQGKSISQKGVSSTKERPKAHALVAGNPIGGIIVKGGKNPGGSLMVMMTDPNGKFSFNVSEAGNYKFILIAP